MQGKRNQETEVKIAIADLPGLQKKLRRLPARKVSRVYEHNVLHDTRFRKLARQGKLLRLRLETPAGSEASPSRKPVGKKRVGSSKHAVRLAAISRTAALLTAGQGIAPHVQPGTKSWLTYKGPAAASDKRYKVREELEIAVTEPARVAAILEGLGLQPSFRYEKFRTLYALPGLPGVDLVLDETPIGVYIELEGTPRQIDRAARQLGHTPADYLTASYGQLYRSYCRAHRRPVRNMLFKEI
jgi:adenylate cyclase class IV